jgi:aminoglycoside phosphotransferase (APT) family kinase protein
VTWIGEGESSEVYRVEPGVVVKLFRPGYDDEKEVAREYATARHVGERTELAPDVYKLVTIDGRPGYSMEEVVGACFQEVIDGNPDSMGEYARLLGAAHRSLHSVDVTGALAELPRMSDVFPGWIAGWDTFATEIREWLVSLFVSLEGEARLGHGDFMPYNIMITDGRVRAVDWAETGLGPPLTDVARTINFIYDWTDYPDSIYTTDSTEFISDYLDAYSDGVGVDPDELQKCLIINAAGECQWANVSGQADAYSQRLSDFVNANFAEYGSDTLVDTATIR